MTQCDSPDIDWYHEAWVSLLPSPVLPGQPLTEDTCDQAAWTSHPLPVQRTAKDEDSRLVPDLHLQDGITSVSKSYLDVFTNFTWIIKIIIINGINQGDF